MSNVVRAVLQIDDQASPQIREVANEAENAAENTEGLSNRLQISRDTLMKFGAAALAGAAAVGALVKSVADARNVLIDAATQTGLTAKTIAGLKLAAEGAGLELDALTGGLVDLPKRMDEAKRGTGEALVAFERLGIAVTDANGNLRSADDVLSESIAKLQGVENSAERAALATILFGGAGANIMQAVGGTELEEFVNQAERFGVNVGPEAVKAANNLRRELAQFSMTTDRAKEAFISAFGSGPGGASTVVKAFGGLLIGLTAGFKFAMDNARSFVGGFTQMIGDVVAELINFGSVIDLIMDRKFRQAADKAGESFERLTAAAQVNARQTGDAIVNMFSNKAIRVGFEQGMAAFNAATAGTGGGQGEDDGGDGRGRRGDNQGQEDQSTQKLADLLQQQIDAANALIPDTRSQSQIMAQQLEALIAITAKTGTTPEARKAIEGLRDALNAQRQIETEQTLAELDRVAEEIEQMRQRLIEIPAKIAIGFANALSDPGTALAQALGPAGGIVSAVADLGAKNPKQIAKEFRQFFNNIVQGLTSVIPELIVQLPKILIESLPKVFEGLIKSLPKIIGAVVFKLPAVLINVFGSWLVNSISNFFDMFLNDLPGKFVKGLKRWFKGAIQKIKDIFKPGKIFRPETEKGRRRLAVATLGISEAVRGIRKVIKGSRQTGGFTTGGDGLYMLHAGERVVPSTGASTGTMAAASNIAPGQIINISTNVVDPNSIDQLGRQLDRQFGSRGRSFGVGLFNQMDRLAGLVR